MRTVVASEEKIKLRRVRKDREDMTASKES